MLSWGANSYGQLGQGFCSEQCLQPIQILSDENSLDPASAIQIDGGAGHTLILDCHGRIWVCGWNNSHQLGIDKATFVFKQITGYENIKFTQISCGWDFSAAITSNNDLYVWGGNNFGQLGSSKNSIKFIKKPTKVCDLSVKYVSCGLRHMAVITLDNKLQVCGSNVNGQLGFTIDSKKIIDQFEEVPSLKDIKMVGCGQKHTIILTNTNELYACGDNKWGQLGLDPTDLSGSKRPIKLNFPCPDEIVKLHCGWTHNVILTNKGELWTWGRNNYGQLGHNFTNHWQPQKLKLSNVRDVAAGAEHNLAVCENHLYSWGWNEHGNCGDGTQKNILEPTMIFSNALKQNIYCIGCGTGQCFAAVK